MTNVIFIEVLSNGSFNKVVTISSRTPEQFCIDASAYYRCNNIETEVKQSKEDKRFFGVFSCRNGKLMAIAGPEKNQFFWRKHNV